MYGKRHIAVRRDATTQDVALSNRPKKQTSWVPDEPISSVFNFCIGTSLHQELGEFGWQKDSLSFVRLFEGYRRPQYLYSYQLEIFRRCGKGLCGLWICESHYLVSMSSH